ncbi:OsmC family protein [Aureliella helgolandensis]|uniref:OsmC-like protein n=1 Tax=Aureliella helgolandensis TaxID=2527968 RepID=A0A518G935_9BACT|nr:OsmC family protein [Aureliella helgolandensis]QDV25090.1 OsmC-like protein [Aureliella helgolandensis]
MSVEINLEYAGELHCNATHGPSGATLSTDAPVDNGGQGASFSPTDLVATALGACVLTILGLVSARHQIELKGTRVHVTKEMVNTPIRRIQSLKTVVTVPQGAVQEPEMRTRLETAARQCPVHKSLHPEIDAPIDFVYLS